MAEEAIIPAGGDIAAILEARSPLRIICSWCGSDNVSRDAWAAWDEMRQQWVLQTVFDDGHCHACGRERKLEECAADG